MTDERGYRRFADRWQENARLVIDTIAMRPARSIPTAGMNVMQRSHLERFSGREPGSYERDPVGVYLDFQRCAGACFIGQWIPENPLKMGEDGFGEGADRGVTTGVEEIVRDGVRIDSPEAVVEHMEKHLFQLWRRQKRELEADEDGRVQALIRGEVEVQNLFGTNILKVPYSGFFAFPMFLYPLYGYQSYFMAYALYPDVIERCFSLQADTAEVHNRLAARAILEGELPRMVRLDHDMADSRGTLVDIRSLDRLWFPHFARAIRPLVSAGIRLLWHCDGNLMEMVPRLIEAGVGGFQGFQYEDGMDYERICRMRNREGESLFIMAGVSVTTTLPHGSPGDVRRELDWLVEKGPKTGLTLGCSSSVTPGVPRENMEALLEGFAHYRQHGRK